MNGPSAEDYRVKVERKELLDRLGKLPIGLVSYGTFKPSVRISYPNEMLNLGQRTDSLRRQPSIKIVGDGGIQNDKWSVPEVDLAGQNTLQPDAVSCKKGIPIDEAGTQQVSLYML
jgi:hypothetical protein